LISPEFDIGSRNSNEPGLAELRRTRATGREAVRKTDTMGCAVEQPGANEVGCQMQGIANVQKRVRPGAIVGGDPFARVGVEGTARPAPFVSKLLQIVCRLTKNRGGQLPLGANLA